MIVAAERTLFRQGLMALIARDPRFRVVAEAADGDEARRAAERESPDLAVIDSDLPPPANGCDTLACLRAVAPETAVVVVGEADHGTATEAEAESALRAERARAMQQGAVAYLPARADGVELLRTLTAIAALKACAERDSAGADAGTDPSQPPGGESGRPRITDRERTIVALIAQGLCNKEVAHRLGISTQTVKNHVSHLLEKLALADRTQLAVYAIEHNFEF